MVTANTAFPCSRRPRSRPVRSGTRARMIWWSSSVSSRLSLASSVFRRSLRPAASWTRCTFFYTNWNKNTTRSPMFIYTPRYPPRQHWYPIKLSTCTRILGGACNHNTCLGEGGDMWMGNIETNLRFLSTATTYESRSLASWPSSTLSSASSYVCSTRTRSTLLSISAPSRLVLSAAVCHPRTSRSSSRRQRREPRISLSANTLSRYAKIKQKLDRSRSATRYLEIYMTLVGRYNTDSCVCRLKSIVSALEGYIGLRV